MVTQSLVRLLSRPKAATSVISRRLSISAAAAAPAATTAASSTAARSRLFLLSCLRPLSSAIPPSELRRLSFRGLSTDAAPSAPPAAEPPKEEEKKDDVVLEGCDFLHWLALMDKPEGQPTRDEIIDSYVKTLAMAVGSEEDAKKKIYSVSTRCYYAFSFLGDKELSEKINDLPGVRFVVPDSYLDPKNKDYGGEPFINGKAVPYDPKYHKEWLKNNSQSKISTNRGPRRNVDESRNNFQNNQRVGWRNGNQNQNFQNSPRDAGRRQDFQNSPRDMGRGQDFQNNPGDRGSGMESQKSPSN